MSLSTKRSLNAVSHILWILVALAYFGVIVLLGREGNLQPDALKDTLSESLGYAVGLVLFIVFYAIGIGLGVIEALIHAIVHLSRRDDNMRGGFFLVLSHLIKLVVLADCVFLAYLMADQLLPGAMNQALFFIIPLSVLGVWQIALIIGDHRIKNS